ncbi:hypothetical protein AWL63_03785 [Sphingomonas panacis]|uniref:HTH tetR-type domain-containing protein n=1 Tax=Sphingomonas panacis TaxID=1560345 RepID=A0A1B3Z732_9SPHN|nr:TetR/AcrR family transcriptional regulator [Sphingomonas panacis]AOH83225.1 hypothetical protein AWL63_03785 [Sphingomonas panacis]
MKASDQPEFEPASRIEAAEISSAYVRPPQQSRSLAAYKRITSAARDILIENGLDGFALQEVAARAGVSNGALQYRFASKERLLKTVITISLEDVVEKERDMHHDLRKTCASIGEFMPAYISRYWQIMAAFHPIFSSSIDVISGDAYLSALGRSIGMRNEVMAKNTMLSYFSHPTEALIGSVDAVYHLVFSYILREIHFPSGDPGSADVLRRTRALAEMCEARLTSI